MDVHDAQPGFASGNGPIYLVCEDLDCCGCPNTYSELCPTAKCECKLVVCTLWSRPRDEMLAARVQSYGECVPTVTDVCISDVHCSCSTDVCDRNSSEASNDLALVQCRVWNQNVAWSESAGRSSRVMPTQTGFDKLWYTLLYLGRVYFA